MPELIVVGLQVAARFRGMSTLKPFLDEYKRMRHNLKTSRRELETAQQPFSLTADCGSVEEVLQQGMPCDHAAAQPKPAPIQLSAAGSHLENEPPAPEAVHELPNAAPFHDHVRNEGLQPGQSNTHARSKSRIEGRVCTTCTLVNNCWVMQWVRHPITRDQVWVCGHKSQQIQTSGRFGSNGSCVCPNSSVSFPREDVEQLAKKKRQKQGKTEIKNAIIALQHEIE